MFHNKSIYAQIERVEVTCVVRKNRRPGHAWALALHSGGHSRTRDRDETKRSEFATEPNKGYHIPLLVTEPKVSVREEPLDKMQACESVVFGYPFNHWMNAGV